MAYSGQVYQIPCDRGGLNASENLDTVPPESMVWPCRNVNLHKGGRSTRGGTSHVNTSAIAGTPTIRGIYDWWMQDGTQFIMLGASDGAIYKNFIDTIKTGLSDAYVSFTSAEDILFITNGVNVPMTWNGVDASATNMTNIPSDWTGTNYPKQFIVHGVGASECMWALGFNDGTVYASKDGDLDDLSDSSVCTIPIATGDGFGIVGGFEYGDRLFAVGKTQVYIIDDTSVDRTEWGYQSAQWKGGAAHHRLIVRLPNDVVMMSEDGEIFSVMAAENYGDYKQASLLRPSRMDNWVRDNIDLSYINDFHAVYDPELRAIKFFVVRKGKNTPDTALVYFIDRDAAEAWTVHDNTSYDSGYQAYSSALVRYSTGDYRIYTGDNVGFVWELEQQAANDNSEAYNFSFKTPQLNFGDARVTKMYNALRIVCQPTTDSVLSTKVWIDGMYKTTLSITLDAIGVELDSFLLDTDYLADINLYEAKVMLGFIGKRIQFEFFNTAVNQNFFISQIMIDFKNMKAAE